MTLHDKLLQVISKTEDTVIIITKRNQLKNYIIQHSNNLSRGNYKTITPEDIYLIFQLYDKFFFIIYLPC